MRLLDPKLHMPQCSQRSVDQTELTGRVLSCLRGTRPHACLSAHSDCITHRGVVWMCEAVMRFEWGKLLEDQAVDSVPALETSGVFVDSGRLAQGCCLDCRQQGVPTFSKEPQGQPLRRGRIPGPGNGLTGRWTQDWVLQTESDPRASSPKQLCAQLAML